MPPKNGGSKGGGGGRGGGGRNNRGRGGGRGGRGNRSGGPGRPAGGQGGGGASIVPSQLPKNAGLLIKDPPNLVTESDSANNNNAAGGDNGEGGKEPEPHTVCLVCYDSDLPLHRTILPCGHDDICAPCHLRLRYLHSDRRCPVCKTINDRAIVDADPPHPDAEKACKEHAEDGLDEETHTHKPYSSYEMWGEDLGSGYIFRDDVGMFFPTEYHATDIAPIFSLGCQVPGCGFTNETDTFVTESKYDENKRQAKQKREVKRQSGIQALNTHLRTVHGLTLCNLCYMAKRDYVSHLPRFTPNQLKFHQTRGDGSSSGFTGHPLCEFCRPRRFYDLTKLHEHLNKEHYKCHICDKQGRPNQFFKNYNSLTRHFDREHFLCHNPQCLAARFVVFENEIDLQAHERSVHGGTSTGSAKINLEFNIRRSGYGGEGYENQDQEAPREEDFQYGLDGEAFVPEALPNQEGGGGAQQARQENEPEITHVAHAERTAELRAEAAQMREAQKAKEQEEAFPTLGGEAAGSGMVGWTAEGRAGLGRRGKGQLTKEDFPALSTGPKKTSIAARALRPSGHAGASTAGRSTARWSSSTPVERVNPQQSEAFFTPSTVAASMNRQSNLASDNFPSLEGPSSGGVRASSGPKYATTNAFGRKNSSQQGPRAPAPPTGADFPSLSATTPLSAQAASQKAARARLLGAKKPPSQQALDNMMEFPPPRKDDVTFNDDLANGKDVVRQMKAALGQTKYKELKRLTNYYAAGDMTPDGYVDMASALFDRGAGDACFWKYMPGLIQSCPNERDNAEAMTYMENLRVADALQKQEDNVASRSATQASLSGYAARSYGGRSEGYTPRVVPSKKKKGAWKGAGGATTTARTKPAAGSVAAQAAQEAPQAGTATKYMAQAKKEERKQTQQESQQKQGGNKEGTSRKAKAKKKNDELKALAFGGK